MLGRILVATLMLGLGLVALPTDDGPVENAAAYCIWVEALDKCVSDPVCPIVAATYTKVTGRPAGCPE